MSSWEEDNAWKVDIILERQREYLEDVENGIWRMADGTRIAIKDMRTNHINNCIKMILRSKNHWRKEYLETLQRELLRRKWKESHPDAKYTIQ